MTFEALAKTALFGAVATGAFALTPADAQQRPFQREIVIENNCSRPIRILISHADDYQNWHPHGWFYVSPYRSSRLNSNNVVLTQSEGHSLYVYFEIANTRGVTFEGNDVRVTHEGTNYGLRRVNTRVSGGQLVVPLSC